ncbi:M28 family peptidase [Rubripirellula reticaptiva]|uniref:Aminopeptidase S n=1 Tax=Rubripirellula reticaptiva TaxID=2528013 RepID=A0A5C6F1H2_9BACT|nr:M28 family peptidase [Rubripirellula reticaptiva]TWU55102.1 Aminopeptidase S [Rubripirellula reticaptiva]
MKYLLTAILVCTLPTLNVSAQDTASVEILSAADNSAAEVIDEASLRGHVRFLADDLLEGRGPGSRGDAVTQLYLSTQFQSLGLEPAAADGGWLQPVPLVGVKTEAPAEIKFQRGNESVSLKSVTDFMSTIGSPKTEASIDAAELVFVGYGIQAPEYDWDDFKDVDLRGKVLVVMNNDPSSDPELFEGSRRLYYGRWDYKYESAARQGAAGAIIIHTTPSAGYPWQVIQTSWAGEEFELRDAGGPRMELKAWASEGGAKKIAALAGKDLDALRAAAESRDFRPVPLGVSLSIELTASVRNQDTANVLASLPGSDPDLRDEYVIYMAHHDHLGMSAQRDANGDNIYNGAIDNASGAAALLTMAKAFVQLEPRPARSILFAAVSAEEQGLLGSKFFASDPPIPAGKLAAVINMDGTNIIGRTHDVNVIGMGKSSLDNHVQAVAKAQGRIVTSDHFPDRGYYYRSDQFSLAKIGVPGVYLHSGVNVIGKPDGWGKEQLDQWVEKIYHQPSDEYLEEWNLSGAIEDTRLLFHVGRRVANSPEMPSWTEGDEFEAARKQAIAETPKP